jgi:ABC-type uncharacterized transport system YnjBCD ATPase subunit
MSHSDTLEALAAAGIPAPDKPLLSVEGLTRVYGNRIGCADVSFDLWPGEVLAIVGESGSGKTTLLNCISSRLTPTCGTVHYRMRDGASADIYKMAEAERRYLMRTDWGFVHQNPIDGLRMTVSAGANVGERLMAVGNRHYGNIRNTAIEWLGRGSKSTKTGLMTSRGPSPAACGSGCRSRATWSPSPAGVHGRADRRARCLGAGAAARSACAGWSPISASPWCRHPRSRRGPAAVGPDDRDEGGQGDRVWSDRPGA